MKKHLIIFPLLLTLYTVPLVSVTSGQEMVRVAIMKDQESVKISGGEICITDFLTGQTLASGNNGSVVIKENENGLTINKIPISSTRIKIVNPSGFLKVNGKGYRGTLEVIEEKEHSLLIINELNLEDYLAGMVTQEMSSQWPVEALRAQAVAARTYALFQKANRKDALYHLESTVLDQVYNGSDSENQLSLQAVNNTQGEVITFHNEIISAFYHSCCGGQTEPARLVWQTGSPLLQSVICTFCSDFPRYFWELKLSNEEIIKRFNAEGYRLDKIEDIKVTKRSETNRAMEISIQGKGDNISITGNELRRILGFERLRSTNFIVKKLRGSTQFLGIGYGHGAGLCQWGAKKMAENGYTYRQILLYYYPVGEIKNIYEGVNK